VAIRGAQTIRRLVGKAHPVVMALPGHRRNNGNRCAGPLIACARRRVEQ
jgi:hypothetical protein